MDSRHPLGFMGSNAQKSTYIWHDFNQGPLDQKASQALALGPPMKKKKAQH